MLFFILPFSYVPANTMSGSICDDTMDSHGHLDCDRVFIRDFG